MQPYNVKIITYPDLTKQVRIYKSTVCPPDVTNEGRKRDREPFENKVVYSLSDEPDDWDLHTSEVSLKRTRKKVFDYARSNEWDWFVTFTFSDKRVDRYDYDDCVSKLSKWLNNLRRSSPGVSYIVVPERHKDGAFHFHGLFAGLSEREIVWSGKYVIKRDKGARRFFRTKDKIYQIGRYKFGWMTATQVRDKERVTGYISKYITKEMLNGLYGRKRYWASRNLLLPTEEVCTLDQVDRFILASDLADQAAFSKVTSFSYGSMTQSVEIYEVK